jgi:5'-methylthioadenosine phosphorylase
MTTLPEAKLAREAEICYAMIACATDYDVWHDTHEDVTADLIVANLLKNVEVSRQAVRIALRNLPLSRNCSCATALRDAIVTSLKLVPDETLRRLGPLLESHAAQKAAQG